MPRIVLSEYVEPELSDIWRFIAIDNPAAADRFLESAYETIHELTRMPRMGLPRAFLSERLQSLRSFQITGFEKFLIFYCPIPDGIEVLHILHGARDIENFWGSN